MGVLDPEQMQNARTVLALAQRAGLTPARQQEMVYAAFKESGLRTGATNPQTHAASLFQLLSPGYRARAQQLGGLYDPAANTQAILPDYVSYFAGHPDAPPGAAAAAVERSGKPAAWYAPDGELGAVAPGPAAAPAPRVTPGGGLTPLAKYALDNLRASLGHGPLGSDLRSTPVPDAASLLDAVHAARGASAAASGGGGGGGNIVATAKAYLGVPYKWGGNDPQTGLDCSAFVQQVYAQHGIELPRTTTGQFHAGEHVDLHDLQAGDVIFTEPGRGPLGGPGHEALYLGNGYAQESPHTGTVNQIVPVGQILSGGFAGARRFGASG